MNQSFGSWMLTGGTRGEIDAEARQTQHLRAFRELQSERRAARRAKRSATIASAITGLRARFSVPATQTEPDCCPA
jgi:hypothetical protein